MKELIKELNKLKKIVSSILKKLRRYTTPNQDRELIFYEKQINEIIDEVIDKEIERITNEQN